MVVEEEAAGFLGVRVEVPMVLVAVVSVHAA